MVRTDTKTEPVKNLFQRNTHPDWKSGSSGISVESTFQRGDEDTGVWSTQFKQSYIDSLQKGYPSGIITFVKDFNNAMSSENPWKVLDGGNRMRTIRDYMDDKFVDLNGNKYTELTPEERAEFNNILIPCQEITIERSDPESTIADMFIRLNTKTNPLRHGELFKAHGHRSDVWEIELAKKIIGDIWSSQFTDNNDSIKIIREFWETTLGELRETSRCDTLAMMIGYIISAKTSSFVYFDKRYKNLSNKLSYAGEEPSQDILDQIYKKFREFLDILNNIDDKSIFGKTTKGIPPQIKISPIWKKVCEGTMTQIHRKKFIDFYNTLSVNVSLKNKYLELFKGSNSETSTGKIQKIVDFILFER